jgi:hypothetical protein
MNSTSIGTGSSAFTECGHLTLALAGGIGVGVGMGVGVHVGRGVLVGTVVAVLVAVESGFVVCPGVQAARRKERKHTNAGTAVARRACRIRIRECLYSVCHAFIVVL